MEPYSFVDTLPPYSFVEPRFLVAPADFHPKDSDNLIPGHNSVQAGEYFVAQLYNAWKNSPGRNDPLLILIWDEAGGLADFVSPRPGCGVRVPTLFHFYSFHSIVSSDTHLFYFASTFISTS